MEENFGYKIPKLPTLYAMQQSKITNPPSPAAFSSLSMHWFKVTFITCISITVLLLLLEFRKSTSLLFPLSHNETIIGIQAQHHDVSIPKVSVAVDSCFSAKTKGFLSSSCVNGLVRGGELHLPGAYARISYTSFTREEEVISVTIPEEHNVIPCTFISDINTATPADCLIEKQTRNLIRSFLRPTDHVMELGARYGTASCEVSKLQNNSGTVVSVDPDISVWPALELNRYTHKCGGWLVRGVISDRGVTTVEENGYATRAVAKDAGRGPNLLKTSFTLNEIQNITGLHLTALIIDCEGCLPFLFQGASSIRDALANIRVILMEGDMPKGAPDCKHDCVDYIAWENKFADAGFTMIEKEQDKLFPWIYNYVFEKQST